MRYTLIYRPAEGDHGSFQVMEMHYNEDGSISHFEPVWLGADHQEQVPALLTQILADITGSPVMRMSDAVGYRDVADLPF